MFLQREHIWFVVGSVWECTALKRSLLLSEILRAVLLYLFNLYDSKTPEKKNNYYNSKMAQVIQEHRLCNRDNAKAVW